MNFSSFWEQTDLKLFDIMNPKKPGNLSQKEDSCTTTFSKWKTVFEFVIAYSNYVTFSLMIIKSILWTNKKTNFIGIIRNSKIWSYSYAETKQFKQNNKA